MIGDDNSNCFKGTWNTDFSVKTVTRATGSIASPISACDLVFLAQNNLQNDSSTGVYYSNGKIGVISAVTNNFKPSIDKPIPTLVYYNYRNFSNPSYYYWYQNRSVLTNLSVLNGTYNFTFDFDYLGKHYSIKKRMIISYQFTDTINTVNPDCNVKAETKYQSVNITLPFNLVISPQDRWCEIHLSRVDYITTVSGGFPNTAVRVDFTSSSGHDPNYSNRIMYFDANGNLTFSNFCTQQSHSGSVDTWNITYMGKHYHFTIHWYW